MARMSYMGYCNINDTLIKCTSISVSKKVDPIFYDHVVGLKDVNYSAATAKGPGDVGGYDHRQKGIWRWSRFMASVSISGPLTSDAFPILMDNAINGDTLTTADFVYYSGEGNTITDAFISSLTIDIKAGDVATFSAEITGTDETPVTDTSATPDCEKLVTWDACDVDCVLMADPHEMVGLSFSITNPPVPIYTSGTTVADDLGPDEIRIGMQEVKGTATMFEPHRWVSDQSSYDSMVITIDGNTYTMSVLYSPSADNVTPGPFTSSVQFVGASDGPVWS